MRSYRDRISQDVTLMTEGQQSAMSKPFQVGKKKKEHLKIIEAIDVNYFSKEKPTDPTKFIEDH